MVTASNRYSAFDYTQKGVIEPVEVNAPLINHEGLNADFPNSSNPHFEFASQHAAFLAAYTVDEHRRLHSETKQEKVHEGTEMPFTKVAIALSAGAGVAALTLAVVPSAVIPAAFLFATVSAVSGVISFKQK
jgi:hypothetical protein